MRAVYMTFLKELLKRCMQQKKYNKKKAKIKCTNVNAPALNKKHDGDSCSDSMSTNSNTNVIQPEISLIITSKVGSASTSNPSLVYKNCEIQPEEIYENMLQDSMKTNNKG